MRPRYQSCITAIAVKLLVMDPILKTVSYAIGVREAMSATPCPWKN